MPNPQNTIELHPEANPSRPSVKFTELLKEIIVIIAIGIIKNFKLIVKSSSKIKLLINRKITKNDENNNCSINFSLPLSPKFILFFMPK